MIENFPSKLNPTWFHVSGQAIKEVVELSLDEEHIRQDGRGAGFRGYVLGTLGFSSNVKITKNPLTIMIDGQMLDEEKEYYIVSDDYLQRGTGYPSLRVGDDEAAFDKRFIRDVVEEHLMDGEAFESAKIQRVYE